MMSASASKIKSLLDAGADVNTRFEEGVTPLMAACVHGDLATIDVLLKAGADLDLQQDVKEMTALMKAALWDHPRAVTKLIAAGADVNITTQHGWTALMYAVLSDNPQIVRALLNAGADAAAKDYAGKAALDYARERGHTRVVALLS